MLKNCLFGTYRAPATMNATAEMQWRSPFAVLFRPFPTFCKSSERARPTFKKGITARKTYNSDWWKSDGDAKTLVDRDGRFGCVRAAGSAPMEFHSHDCYRAVPRAPCPQG